jgi:diadenosine tetraphosphate (Ap4A) HIT family hydrolase
MTQLINQYSHLTAIDRPKLSFPANLLRERNLLQGNLLDFGCGLGNDVKILRQRGFNITGYDPHYFGEYPQQQFDTILCLYVLNVLLPQEQSRVVMEISQLLKLGGKAYYAVRRDVKWEGFREHYVHKKDTYQCLVKLPFKSIYTNENCEIYEYTHYHYQDHPHNHCLFCRPSKKLTLITESINSYAIFDPFPVSKGHSLVIPKTHTQNFFDLPLNEQVDCWLMVKEIQNILITKFNAEGFNIGLNINHCAGQKMPHSTIHVIPRYGRDSHGNKGGIRWVIPTNRHSFN